MKRLIFTLTLSCVTLLALSQEAKKGCNPSACKPGNTKVEEALAITNLRDALVEIKKELQEKNLIQVSQISKGKNDTESLAIIIEEVNDLEKMLGQPQTNFSQWKGALLVSKLENAIQELDH